MDYQSSRHLSKRIPHQFVIILPHFPVSSCCAILSAVAPLIAIDVSCCCCHQSSILWLSMISCSCCSSCFLLSSLMWCLSSILLLVVLPTSRHMGGFGLFHLYNLQGHGQIQLFLKYRRSPHTKTGK